MNTPLTDTLPLSSDTAPVSASIEGWEPADYQPGITVDTWLTLLDDPDVFDANSLLVMARMLDTGGQATCKQLAQEYGQTPGYYNAVSTKLALRVVQATGCPLPSKGSKSGERWPVLYVGRPSDDGTRSFIWRLRPELEEALSQYERLPSAYLGIEQQSKYTLTITADSITSTDPAFSLDNLNAGDNYVPRNVVFITADGRRINRDHKKRENRISNRTLPFLAFQLFEEQIAALSEEERLSFPTCQYSPTSEPFRGIFPSVEAFRKYRKTIERVIYTRDNGELFVIYCWNVFSTLHFAQECLRRFGAHGDSFELVYSPRPPKAVKGDSESASAAASTDMEDTMITNPTYQNPYCNTLLSSFNIIFHGAPGTGKTYLARQLAAEIVSGGTCTQYKQLTPDQKKRIGFVQFHPSYDYTDFVEGLRPVTGDDGIMRFELQDGIFKGFVDEARRDYERSLKSTQEIVQELSIEDAFNTFMSSVEYGIDEFKIKHGNAFYIISADEDRIRISIPANTVANNIVLKSSVLRQMLESDIAFDKIAGVASFLGQKNYQAYSYYLTLYREILKRKKASTKAVVKAPAQNYVFIIDEINRGEISKIFGELFFSIDPGYRGEDGAVSTQYANLHADPHKKFYIPPNVYVIGTMNDIDRSVDRFDFAMRRRFRCINIEAAQQIAMLDSLPTSIRDEAIRRMTALNRAIAGTEGLGPHYQIGPAYFLKVADIGFDALWSDYLAPLLADYVSGMYHEAEHIKKFEKEYRLAPAENPDEAH